MWIVDIAGRDPVFVIGESKATADMEPGLKGSERRRGQQLRARVGSVLTSVHTDRFPLGRKWSFCITLMPLCFYAPPPSRKCSSVFFLSFEFSDGICWACMCFCGSACNSQEFGLRTSPCQSQWFLLSQLHLGGSLCVAASGISLRPGEWFPTGTGWRMLDR